MTAAACPACGSTSVSAYQEHGSGIRTCAACGVEFADMGLYRAEAYAEGYAEECSELAVQGDYAAHAQYARWLATAPTVEPFLLPTEREAVAFLRKKVPHGAPVLDIGCGAGRLLLALREAGFHAHGLEVAPLPVEILARAGLEVARGGLEDFPAAWPLPAAVVLFEVLEHLPDPSAFLRLLREKFPEAVLLLTVPASASRRRFDAKFRDGDVPPNHLTRWTKNGLHAVLERAGFAAIVTAVYVTGADVPLRLSLKKGKGATVTEAAAEPPPSPTAQEYAQAARMHRLRGLLLSPVAALMRLLGGGAFWFLAVATPKENRNACRR